MYGHIFLGNLAIATCCWQRTLSGGTGRPADLDGPTERVRSQTAALVGAGTRHGRCLPWSVPEHGTVAAWRVPAPRAVAKRRQQHPLQPHGLLGRCRLQPCRVIRQAIRAPLQPASAAVSCALLLSCACWRELARAAMSGTQHPAALRRLLCRFRRADASCTSPASPAHQCMRAGSSAMCAARLGYPCFRSCLGTNSRGVSVSLWFWFQIWCSVQHVRACAGVLQHASAVEGAAMLGSRELWLLSVPCLVVLATFCVQKWLFWQCLRQRLGAVSCQLRSCAAAHVVVQSICSMQYV